MQDTLRLNRWASRLVFLILLCLAAFYLSYFAWWNITFFNAGSVPQAEIKQQVSPQKNKLVTVQEIMRSLERHNPWGGGSLGRANKEKTAIVAVPSTLDLVLIGTFIVPGGKSQAVLVKSKKPQAPLYLRLGDEVDNAILEKIERNAVFFLRNGRYEIISMSIDAAVLKKGGIKGEGQAASSARPGVGLAMSRQRYTELLRQGKQLIKGVNISPYYQGDKSLGYRLQFSPENKNIHEFGISSGDVIEKVNGVPVNDAAAVSKMIRSLEKLNNINIDLIREGAPRSVTVQID